MSPLLVDKSCSVGETKLEGYLEKMSSGLRKKWQPRYFIISTHYLKYFTVSLFRFFLALATRRFHDTVPPFKTRDYLVLNK
jgi:hypothetical protein